MSDNLKVYASQKYVQDEIKKSYTSDLIEVINSENTITLVEGVDVFAGEEILVHIEHNKGGSVKVSFPDPELPGDYVYVPYWEQQWPLTTQPEIYTIKVTLGCSYEIFNGGADIRIVRSKSNFTLQKEMTDHIKNYNNHITSTEKTELGYLSGTTSNIQEQINDVNNLVGTSILSESRNVYVSPSGSDTTGDGTSSNPWKTITKAIEYGPVARNGYNLYYTINIAAGTYEEDIIISDKKVQFNLLGNVIIQSASGHTALSIFRNARLAISSDKNNKKPLTLSGAAVGIKMNHESTLVLDYLSNLIFYDITDTCISCLHNAYLTINEDSSGRTLDCITIHSSCKLMSIVSTQNNSHVELDTTMDIESGSTCSSYAFISLTDSYLLISKLTIPSTYSKGILASYMGRVNLINVTNNATTKTHTLLGGLIAE